MKYADRVKQTSTTTGTASWSLSPPPPGFQAFSDALSVGDTDIPYCAVMGAEWEVGVGTLQDSSTLTRDAILDSSAGGEAVNFGVGEKTIICVIPAAYADGIVESAASTSIKLDASLRQYSPLTITGATQLTVTGNKAGAHAAMVVVADGVNVPTVVGADEWASSFGYINTAGDENRLDVWFDGSAARYSWSHAQNPASSATAPGATLTGASSVTSGSASGDADSSAPGATLSGTSSISAGSASGGSGTTPQAVEFSSKTANMVSGGTEIWYNNTGGTFDAIGQVVGALAGDGWLEIEHNNTTDSGGLLTFDVSSGLNVFQTCDFCAQVTPSGLVLYGENPTNTTSTGYTFGASGAGCRMRLRRSGSTITIETTTDDGGNWATRHTFVSTSSATLYARLYTSLARRAHKVRQVGVA